MTWWDGQMVGFDLETTSADPEEARIVTAALIVVGPRVEGQERAVERHSWLVNPGVKIPDEAAEIHGITTERARAEGRPLNEVMVEITEMLERAALATGAPVIIHNARYDLTVSDRELRRLGAPTIAHELTALSVIDPIVIERHLDRYRPKRVASHSLEDCCRVWNVVLDGAHDATFDALAAVRLAWRLGKGGRVIRRTRSEAERREFIELTQEWEAVRGDLPALMAWQQRIAWAEAERLQAYFRGGDPAKDVPPQPDRVVPREWPIIPFGGASEYGGEGTPVPVQEAPEWTI